MNSRDRVFSAVTGNEVDRRAFTAMLSLYGAAMTKCPLQTYYNDAEAYVRGQSAVFEAFHPDILFSPFMLTGEGEAFGSKLRYFENQPPNLYEPAINSAEQIADLAIPDIDTHPRLLYYRDALKNLVQNYGNDVAICSPILSPVDLPIMIMGIDSWMQTVLFEEDQAKLILDVTTKHFINWANTLLDDGADFLAMPAAFLNPSVVTRDIVENFTLPIFQEVFAQVNGPLVIHHAGAPILEFLELYRELPNVVAFAVDQMDNLPEARRKIGDDKLLMGGIDGSSISKMTVGQIEKNCSEVLTNRCDDRRFIFYTTGPDIPYDTPEENIRAFCNSIEAVPVA